MGQADVAQATLAGVGQDGHVLLHPFFMARLGGIPSSAITAMPPSQTYELLLEIEELDARLRDARVEICDAIEAAVPDAEGRAATRALIQLKRDIYNRRYRSGSDQTLQYLHADIARRVNPFLDEVNRLHAMREAIAALYKADVEAGRDALKSLWRLGNLRTGVLASNRFLYQQLSKNLGSSSPLPNNKKIANMCDSLLSYASRSALKASPLTSFTLLWAGRWADDSNAGPSSLAIDSAPTRRETEVKHAALWHALEPIWTQLEVLGPDFPLMLNPTAHLEDGNLLFVRLFQSSYRHPKVWGANGHEASVALNAGLKFVISIVRKGAGHSASFRQIAASMEQFDFEQVKARDLVEKMLELQILTPKLERYEQDPILPWLRQTLDDMGTKDANEIGRLINDLSHQADAFRASEESDRVEIVEAAERAVDGIAQRCNPDVARDVLRPAIYEDFFIDLPRCEMPTDAIDDVKDDLQLLLELAPAMDFNHILITLIARHFVANFGEDGECEDVRTFFKSVEQTYFGPQSEIDYERMSFLHEEQMKLESGRALNAIRKEYFDHLAGVDCDKHSVQVSRGFIRELIKKMPDTVRSRHLSQCFTGQFVGDTDSSEKLFVLNQTFPGATGLMSRFFADFSEAELGQIKRYLDDFTPGDTVVEVPAMFGFNANLHPKLADREIAIPGNLPGRKETEKIALEMMKLKYCKKTDRVVICREDEELDLLYFGFMAPALLPRALRPYTISSTQNLILYASREREREQRKKGLEVFQLPRISIGNVCIARQCKVFTQAAQPNPELGDQSFFEEVFRWRRRWGLPRYAFWRFLPEFANDATSGQPKAPIANVTMAMKGQTRFDPTSLKPSFVDFESPNFARLFKRALAKNKFDLAIEEALPNVDQHYLKLAGEPHLVEFQIEVSSKGRQA